MSTDKNDNGIPPKELLTPEEVSELTGYSLKALANHRAEKIGFPYYKFLNRRVFYKKTDIMEAIEKGRVETTPKAS